MVSDVRIGGISGGRISRIAGWIIVISATGAETGSYFLPEPVDLFVRRGPIQLDVFSTECSWSAVVCWSCRDLVGLWWTGSGLAGVWRSER